MDGRGGATVAGGPRPANAWSKASSGVEISAARSPSDVATGAAGPPALQADSMYWSICSGAATTEMNSRPRQARIESTAIRSSGSAMATIGVPNLRLTATTWWRRERSAGRIAAAVGSTP